MRTLAGGCTGVLTLLLVLPLLPAAADQAGGVAEGIDVRLPSVAIGKTYSTWQLSPAPFVVRNTTDDTLRVHVEVVVPARHDLRPGVRPVPDRGWVQVESDHLVLAPHTTQRTDVRLSLPYDPDLAGHTYEVDLWSSEVRADGTRAPQRRRHRLLFAVEMDYRDDTETEFASRSARPHEQL